MSPTFAIVTTSVGSRVDARAIALTLVEQRLTACIQIMPIDSIYCWAGAIEEAEEFLLICKIRAEDYAAVETAIKTCHPYDLPEIVAVSIAQAEKTYGAWIAAATER